jgi:hypothetical protein
VSFHHGFHMLQRPVFRIGLTKESGNLIRINIPGGVGRVESVSIVGFRCYYQIYGDSDMLQ